MLIAVTDDTTAQQQDDEDVQQGGVATIQCSSHFWKCMHALAITDIYN
jgi:hypothetical protein